MDGAGEMGQEETEQSLLCVYLYIESREVLGEDRSARPGPSCPQHPSSAPLGLGAGRPWWRAREAESEQNTPALEEPVI